ncbi:MAG: nucleotidyl transferase AbiEii/AbiGii toxin family protein [Candidatus Eremiobacteraeota bacterium]|nr:nucleotidyl transferase AbiEii/AbiGii toxin family protein [Candidatus Eremiobacteraeota bacterium]
MPSLALSILHSLGQEEGAEHLEVGGGIALWHYTPHRSTNDIDAWWLQENSDSRAAIQRTMEKVSAENGLDLSSRSQAGCTSWDLKKAGKVVFAFQVAPKTARVEPPGPARWGRLRMETLAENLSNKMNALVQRGAPRDIVDVATVLRLGLFTADELWTLWQRKRPELSVALGQANILKYLNALESRRPLESIADLQERRSAEQNRATIRGLATFKVDDDARL